jgi:hypothetical protein
MQIAEPSFLVSIRPSERSRDNASYLEAAALASTLSRYISSLAANKSNPERRRLSLLRDVATQIHNCLAGPKIK